MIKRIQRLLLGPQSKTGEWVVVGFTLTYLLTSLVIAWSTQNLEFVLYFVVMTGLILTVTTVHRLITLSIGTLWGLSLWGLAHMAGGLVGIPETWPIGGDSPVLYNWWLIPHRLKYDQVVHFFGFGIVTWVCWQGVVKAFTRHQINVQPTFGLMVLCVAGGMGFGAANEVVEFVATQTLPNTNVGGYENTGWDLIANFCGCLMSAVLIRLLKQRRQRWVDQTKPGDNDCLPPYP